jgi:hypothetical protein
VTAAAVRPSTWPNSPGRPRWRAAQIHEPGLPRLDPHPAAIGGRHPAGSAEPGFIDTQQRCRLRLAQHQLGERVDRPLHGRPPQSMRRRDLGHRPASGHRSRHGTAQPTGGARPGRQLVDALGERPTTTAALQEAPPAPLAPHHRQRRLTIRQVPRPGQHVVLPDRDRILQSGQRGRRTRCRPRPGPGTL